MTRLRGDGVTVLTHRIKRTTTAQEFADAVCSVTSGSERDADTLSMELHCARYRVGSSHPDTSIRRIARGSLFFIAMIAIAAILDSGSAQAALQEYRMSYAPSPSASAVGYTLHIGEAPGDYTTTFDLGNPPPAGANA